ncbi:unnamed protein product [Soboliphyme baturini]|uniref:FAD synthase n=1 Tax=Soboliphyme baturini TaxID=241478 RepID=A0A183ISR8_9BILA|nr:unnamed protein product [Soboliphyme baturini]
MLTLNGDIKESLETLKKSHPKYKVVFMGSRLSDPGIDKLNETALTDPDWPSYLRLFPLLHWSYTDVWKFLRDLWLPYCTLYDQGYTSLGNMRDTLKNASLKIINPDGEQDFLAAYLLGDPKAERFGRRFSDRRPEFL